MARTTPQEVRRALRECAEKGVSPIGELLRRHGRELPENLRRGFALLGGAEPLRGTKLGEWIAAGELKDGTHDALLAALFLQGVPTVEVGEGKTPPPTYALRQLEHNLQAFAGMLIDNWPGTVLQLMDDAFRRGEPPGAIGDSIGREDPDLEAVGIVLNRVRAYLQTIEGAEQAIEAAGFRYNWNEARLELPPGREGGASRTALGYLVEALVQAWEHEHGGKPQNTVELREFIAGELAPLFSADVLNTAKGSKIDNAVKRYPRRR